MNNNLLYGVVLVTAGSQDEAESIAGALIESKLAACVTMTQVNSLYLWQGKVERDKEWQLIIKSKLSAFSPLESKIKELHSYDEPEIILLPIVNGSQSYLNWIGENVIS